MGYIYVFTNPSFPQYVKIGFADDIYKRLSELNGSTAVPFAFRCYATYEVDSELSDRKIHSILDKLNPDLRSVEDINGKKRIREFYAMTPEDAYSILEAIAEINNYKHRLKKWKATDEEQKNEKIAKEIDKQHRERASAFSFDMCEINRGEKIEFFHKGNLHSGEECEVYDSRHVKYNDKIWSMTSLAKYFLNTTKELAGPNFFKYKGEWLNDIRARLEK